MEACALKTRCRFVRAEHLNQGSVSRIPEAVLVSRLVLDHRVHSLTGPFLCSIAYVSSSPSRMSMLPAAQREPCAWRNVRRPPSLTRLHRYRIPDRSRVKLLLHIGALCIALTGGEFDGTPLSMDLRTPSNK
jgi:hypothetical protein